MLRAARRAACWSSSSARRSIATDEAVDVHGGAQHHRPAGASVAVPRSDGDHPITTRKRCVEPDGSRNRCGGNMKRHELRCYDYVNRPYAQVSEALGGNAHGVFERATHLAVKRAEAL